MKVSGTMAMVSGSFCRNTARLMSTTTSATSAATPASIPLSTAAITRLARNAA